MTFRDRPSVGYRFLPVWVALVGIVTMVLVAAALSAWADDLAPGPDDDLPLEEYDADGNQLSTNAYVQDNRGGIAVLP